MSEQRGSVALRAILMRSFVVVTVIAVLTLGIPLGIVLARYDRQSAVDALEREALRVLALGDFEARPPRMPGPVDPAVRSGAYGQDGHLLAGVGPGEDADARGALGDGVTRVRTEAGQLAVYVPLRPEGASPLTVRVVTSLAATTRRTYLAWAALAALMIAATAVAALLGRWRAAQLARPFERLGRAATDFSAGGFALTVGPTGVREGDQLARALESAAQSAAAEVTAARELAQDASHQVRTPITAARLALESALDEPATLPAAVGVALAQLDRAGAALAEVLELRDPRRGVVNPAGAGLASQLEEVAGRWAPIAAAQSRVLESGWDPECEEVTVPGAVLRQALDVLIDNALQHGRGRVGLHARVAGDWALVDVCDEGQDLSGNVVDLFSRGTGRGSGLGLAVARSLAQSVSGRLVLAGREPTRFSLVLPVRTPGDQDAMQAAHPEHFADPT